MPERRPRSSHLAGPADAALVSSDSKRINQLLAISSPAPEDLVDAARLLMRYQGLASMRAIAAALEAHLGKWGLDRDGLNARTRDLWASGWRPAPTVSSFDPVGSGADVAAS